MKITTAAVTVMRSHDYCHFSVTLGLEAENYDAFMKDGVVLQQIDDLRKEAARLADKAVTQYKIAKANRIRLENEGRCHEIDLHKIERIRAKAETDRTPEEQEELKNADNTAWQASRRFNYEDDWQDDGEEDV